MDNLITLIFIIIAVLSLLGKIQSKKKAGAQSSSTGGWMAKLNTYLTDLQNKIEQQAKTSTTNASGWDELMDETDEDDDLEDSDEYSLEDLVLEDEQPPPRLAAKKEPPAPSPVSAPARMSDRSIATPEPSPQPALHACKTMGSILTRNRQDLRKAIIWSEILGPPVALKDTSEHQR
jgi:hypothetical protein